MHEDLEGLATFVVKAEDLRVLDQLIPDEPQPISLDWINRATNQKTFYGAARAKPNRPPESPLCVPLPSPT